jgi:hypothetical protein
MLINPLSAQLKPDTNVMHSAYQKQDSHRTPKDEFANKDNRYIWSHN